MGHIDGNTNNEELQYFPSHDVSMEQSAEAKPKNKDCNCRGTNLSPAISFLREMMTSVASIYADQSGSLHNLCQGFFIIALAGIALGSVMPRDENLPTPWYRLASSIIGYTYFMIWSVAYYPQIITIHIDKSISGLSTDYIALTTLNCICYVIYNSFFFWNKAVREEYKDLNGGPDTPITIESNDVAYAIHALLISFVTTLQVAYYHGFRIYPLSRATLTLIICFILFSGIYTTCILLHLRGFRWLYFLDMMGMLKILLGSIAYVPQIILNYKLKSTEGYNMWGIYLDFGGGLLSMLQLILDSIDLGDLMGGIMGNWAKLALGVLTLCFDSTLLIQHCVLYNKTPISMAVSSNA